MKFIALAIIALILIAIGILGLFTYAKIPKLKDKKRLCIRICICIIAIGLVITATFLTIYAVASNHGMDNPNITISETIDGIKHTPKKDNKLPDDTKGSIIILYKFDCDDCKAIYNDLSNALKDNQNIYWIPSTSKLGKKLTEEFTVTEVPTGLYMRHNDYNGSIKAVKYELAITDNNNNTILNETLLNRLLYLQSEKK